MKVQGVIARQAEWDLVRGNHQGQRSMTAQTGRTQDCTRPRSRNLTLPLATREPSTQDFPKGRDEPDFSVRGRMEQPARKRTLRRTAMSPT